jgi:hypothetical protein
MNSPFKSESFKSGVNLIDEFSRCNWAFKFNNIVPYTPQKNGVPKRKNHTLKEMTNYDY